MFNPGGASSSSNEPPPPSYDQIFGANGPPPQQVNSRPASGLPYATSPPPRSSSFNSSFNGATSPPPPPPQPPAQGPPVIVPGSVPVDPDSQVWFAAVDENGDGRISVYELQEALINFDGKPFDLKTCHFLVRMFDDNGDGTIDIHEFCALKTYIDKWKKQFDRVDVDRSGNIDKDEMTTALSQLGYTLTPQFSSRAMRVFGNTRGRGSMNFDAFIRCCAFIHSMSTVFSTKMQNQQRQPQTPNRPTPPPGTVSFGFEDFVRTVFEFALADD